MKEAARYEMTTKTTIKPTNNNTKRTKVPFFLEASFVSIFFIFYKHTVSIVEPKGTTIE
jgi:hypothetical protein